MSYSAFPTGAELREWLLKNRRVPVDYDGDLDTPVQAAATQFAREAGWSPFLGDGTQSERRFDPPGPARSTRGSQGASGLYALVTGGHGGGGGSKLFLDDGLTGPPSVVSVAGQELALDLDYWLGPQNSDAQGWPWTIIEFRFPVYAPPRGVAVHGPWGFCAPPPEGQGVPADVWLAIVQGAVGSIYYGMPNVPDLQSISRDGLTESYEIASTPTAGQSAEAMVKYFWETIKGYRRGY